MINYRDLPVGGQVELELNGVTANHVVRATVLSHGSADVQLRLMDERVLTVPLTAVKRVRASIGRERPQQVTAWQPAKTKTQGELARSLRSTLQTLDLESDAKVRVRTIRTLLEDILSDISPPVNQRRAQEIAQIAAVVERQVELGDYSRALEAHRRALSAIQEAASPVKADLSSATPLVAALEQVWNRIIDEHKNHWKSIDKPPQHPPRIVTRDRVNVTRGHDHEFDLPIRISLEESAAEISEVTLRLDKFRGLRLIGGTPTLDRLRPGQAATVAARMRDNRKQGSRSDLRIDAHLTYTTVDGVTQKSPRQTLVLCIQGSEVRIEIPNPYRPYAGGLPVTSPEMFFGRESLVHELVRDLAKTPGGMCFAIYGQQRTGKSSVLEQVKKQLLDREAVVASLSLGTIDRRSMTIDFIEEILDQFRIQIDKRLPADKSRLLLDHWPETAAIERRPLRSFQRAVEAGRSMLRSAGVAGVPFVVVVDEFTYVHEVLRRRGIDPAEHNELKDFMRQLKGLLEARLFSALLIGQDTMPRFLDSYPNEFSVMSTRKLDYLTSEEAQKLADFPIRTPDNSSRYSGYALNTIVSYTDGHPFFTQILCDRVITLVNAHHRSEVTQSDVEEAVESLLAGRECIEAHKFDCLVTADNTRTLISEVESEGNPDGTERALTVLQRIAARSGSQNSPVPIEDLQLNAGQSEALNDLLLRGVLHLTENRVSIRVLLYADYLRRHQR